MHVVYISRQNSETFDISHAVLPLTVAKLSTLENSAFFGPPCICQHLTARLTEQLVWPSLSISIVRVISVITILQLLLQW